MLYVNIYCIFFTFFIISTSQIVQITPGMRACFLALQLALCLGLKHYYLIFFFPATYSILFLNLSVYVSLNFTSLYTLMSFKGLQMQIKNTTEAYFHFSQGWEFAHRFSERIACFLREYERMSDLLKKTSNSLIRSFLVSDLSDSLMIAHFL